MQRSTLSTMMATPSATTQPLGNGRLTKPVGALATFGGVSAQASAGLTPTAAGVAPLRPTSCRCVGQSRGVTSSGLWGFIEVSELVFETNEGLVVDPTEEKMRQEFEHARVLHLPGELFCQPHYLKLVQARECCYL